MEQQREKQMSESLRLGLVLALVGGFLETYTYVGRGGVFANCQTGNLVLLALALAQGAWREAAAYLAPVAAFVAGVLLAQAIRLRFGAHPKLHWRQIVVLFEAACLLGVAFLPAGRWDMLATTTVAFACSLQVHTFRKLHGNPYATTMCTGNLRSAADDLGAWLHTRDRAARRRAGHYALVIGCFMAGAVLGAAFTRLWGQWAVLVCCAGLAAAFGLMALCRQG